MWFYGVGRCRKYHFGSFSSNKAREALISGVYADGNWFGYYYTLFKLTENNLWQPLGEIKIQGNNCLKFSTSNKRDILLCEDKRGSPQSLQNAFNYNFASYRLELLDMQISDNQTQALFDYQPYKNPDFVDFQRFTCNSQSLLVGETYLFDFDFDYIDSYETVALTFLSIEISEHSCFKLVTEDEPLLHFLSNTQSPQLFRLKWRFNGDSFQPLEKTQEVLKQLVIKGVTSDIPLDK